MPRFTLRAFPMQSVLGGALVLMSLAACGPVPPAEVEATSQEEATIEVTEVATPAPTPDDSTGYPVNTVTPRCPDLVATDPATVTLASGGLLLVEFFRFT